MKVALPGKKEATRDHRGHASNQNSMLHALLREFYYFAAPRGTRKETVYERHPARPAYALASASCARDEQLVAARQYCEQEGKSHRKSRSRRKRAP